ncbi:MAG: YeeE/YedE family protein [Gammaproteobacteria bacterium]
MTIDWIHFTPGPALAGGILLGLAAAALALANGRVLGISGIIGGLLRPERAEVAWRLTFLLGLLLAPALYVAVATLPTPVIQADTPTLIVAGLLVGLGTRYGAGCTSGHGVCGLARRSPRSLVATLTFMAAGFITVFLLRHGFA